MSETYYKIWRWKDAPSYLKGKSSLSSGSWVVQYPVGYTFPLSELNLPEHPEWEIDIVQHEASWLTFIRDKDYDMFGTETRSTTPTSTNTFTFDKDGNVL